MKTLYFLFLGLSIGICSSRSQAQSHVISICDTTGVLEWDTLNVNPLDGTTLDCDLADSLSDGKWMVYYNDDTTRPWIIGHYLNHCRNGEYIRFDQEGRMSVHGQYVKGQYIGLWSYYYRGKLTHETIDDSNSWTGRIGRSKVVSTDWFYSSKKVKREFRKQLKIYRKNEQSQP